MLLTVVKSHDLQGDSNKRQESVAMCGIYLTVCQAIGIYVMQVIIFNPAFVAFCHVSD